MRTKYRFSAIAAGVLIASVALLTACRAGLPTSTERAFFDIQTNTVWVTNEMVVVTTQTNVVTTTNAVGAVVWQTNVVEVPQVVPVPEAREEYTLTPGAKAQVAVQTGEAIGNLFGVGGLVGTILGGLFGLWGTLRSSKQGKTAATLAQIIETGSNILQTTPQGQQLDSAWKQWMQKHQTEQGVLTEVLKLLQNTVDEPGAQLTAEKLLKLMQPALAK